jgi:hypothetical protein
MGACFEEKMFPDMKFVDLVQEFERFVERTAWMEGHGGYTGSFAEKDSIAEVREDRNGNRKTVWDKDEAREHCIDYADKWGDALAYRLTDGNWYVGAWCSS